MTFFKNIVTYQAYDSVWREALFAKLNHLGFGGRTLKLIKSMYTNDNLKFMVNGQYSDKLFISRGVKQGSSPTKGNILIQYTICDFRMIKYIILLLVHLPTWPRTKLLWAWN